MVVERLDEGETRPGRFEIVDTRSWTQFSNNIRTNFGFLLRAGQDDTSAVLMEGNMIKQVGNKVFKEVTVAGHRFIVEFLAEHGLTPHGIRRFWLHQANARMNAMILKLAFGHEVGHDRAPMVLERLGNTAAAGAIIALKENHEDMKAGDYGLLCAFGAGYSIGGALAQDDVSADRRRRIASDQTLLAGRGGALGGICADSARDEDCPCSTSPTAPDDIEIIPARKLDGARRRPCFVARGKDFVTRRPTRSTLGFDGIEGDVHAGPTRRSGGREPWYPRGTEMRNERQLSIVAADELALVAARMGIAEIKPEWIGANLVIDGVPRLSMLPAGHAAVLRERRHASRSTPRTGRAGSPGKSIAEHAGMADVTRGGAAVSQGRQAPARAGRLGREAGPVAVGEEVSVRVPEQWIYRG